MALPSLGRWDGPPFDRYPGRRMSDTSEHNSDRRPRRSHARGSWLSELTPAGRIALLAGAALLGVVLVATLADVVASAGRIHPGVRVADVEVGSLTVVEARAKVSTVAATRLETPVTVRAGSRTWQVTAAQMGATVDVIGSVERAEQVGREGGLGRMVADRLGALLGGVTVRAKVDGSPDRTGAALAPIADAVAVPAQDASIAVSGTDVSLLPSRPGVMLDVAKARDAILAALFDPAHTATLVTSPAPVTVTDADAAQALADARLLAGGPVSIVYRGAVHNAAREDVAGWLVFDAVPVDASTGKPAVSDSGAATAVPGATDASSSPATSGVRPAARMALVARFDPTAIGRTILPFTKGFGRPALDAQFVAAKGRVTIKPSQVGLGPDVVSLARELAAECLSGRTRRATLKLVETQPLLTTEQARAMGVADRISTFTTTFNAGNRPRTNNIRLLAAALDNKLVPPGGTFSFNTAAGERTASKGYQEAPAIVNGKLVPQLGGGVCQVGTTFFNAVFFSGLPIIERRNHSFFISHYPKGRDCTVSWGGPDFKWKNDTANWILVRTQISGGSLTISLYGTDPGYQVDYTTSDFTSVVPFKVTEVKDPLLSKGAKVVEDPGVDGATVTVVRTVYLGGKVVRTDTFVSHYKAKEEVVRVGTKVTSKPATGTPVPTP